MAKKGVFYKLSPNLIETFNELTRSDVHPPLLVGIRRDSRTACLESMVADCIRRGLKGKLSDRQLNACKTPEDLFGVFVMYSRACRGEAGYTFIPAPMSWHENAEPTPEQKKKHRKDPAQRIVVGVAGNLKLE